MTRLAHFGRYRFGEEVKQRSLQLGEGAALEAWVLKGCERVQEQRT